jgi:Txe/YoeB family toxin of Txe-Axe toxin-antitoxin module
LGLESKIGREIFKIEISGQMKDERQVFVAFADEKLKEAFEKLKTEDPTLYKFISRAIDDLKENPFCGIAIPKRLIPKIYIRKYGINNLWKYNLPGAWRLLYSIAGNRVKIVAIILEWLSHKEYERRFKY